MSYPKYTRLSLFEIGKVRRQTGINSSCFGMNGFMPDAFENPEGLSFENTVIL